MIMLQHQVRQPGAVLDPGLEKEIGKVPLHGLG